MLGERLRSLRESYLVNGKKISADNLAKKVGLTQGYISSIERGERTPSLESARLLASFFSVSVDYLLGNTDDPSGNNAPVKEPEREEAKPINGAVILEHAAALRRELKENIYCMDQEDLQFTRSILDSCVTMIDSLTDTEKQAKTAG